MKHGKYLCYNDARDERDGGGVIIDGGPTLVAPTLVERMTA